MTLELALENILIDRDFVLSDPEVLRLVSIKMTLDPVYQFIVQIIVI